MQMTEKNKLWLAAIALAILPLTGLTIDVYVPSLPAVSRYFKVDKAAAQLSITLYMLGFGGTQLIAGAITDRIGRKIPTIISLSCYTLFSFLIPVSFNIEQLLSLRLFQGIAVAFFSVAMRAVIADLFEGYQFYKIMNYMTILWAIGPIIAPAIGGYLQSWLGWQASFYLLTVYSLLMLLLFLLFMPETMRNSRQRFTLRNLVHNFGQLLRNKEYVVGLISLGLLYALTILFSIVGPFLIQNVLHYTPIQFGHMVLLMGLGWFLGNVTNRFTLLVSMSKKIRLCFLLMLFNTIIMFSVALFYPVNIYNMLINTFILFYFGGLVFPNYFARCIAIFPKMPGTANSLMGASMILIAGASSAFGTLLKTNTLMPLTVTYMVITLICLGLAFSVQFKMIESDS